MDSKVGLCRYILIITDKRLRIEFIDTHIGMSKIYSLFTGFNVTSKDSILSLCQYIIRITDKRLSFESIDTHIDKSKLSSLFTGFNVKPYGFNSRSLSQYFNKYSRKTEF